MRAGWYVRAGFLAGLCLLSAYLLYPSYYYYAKATPAEQADNKAFCSALPAWSHCAKLNLGLDLQGGVHLVLGVRVDKAIEHRLDRLSDTLKVEFGAANIAVVAIERPLDEPWAAPTNVDVRALAAQGKDAAAPGSAATDGRAGPQAAAAANEAAPAPAAVGLEHADGQTLVATFATPEAREQAFALVRKDFGLFDATKVGDRALTLELSQSEATAIRDGAVEQVIKGIRNRADKLGVTEPTIARRGKDSVLIQLPGVKDPEHAINIIGKTAQLEFKLADKRAAALLRLPTPYPAGVKKERDASGRLSHFVLPESSQEEVARLLGPFVPRGAQLAFGSATGPNREDRPGMLRTYLLSARSPLTGDYLDHAQVSQDPRTNSYAVSMTLDKEGTRIFAQLTADNVGKPMAIVLDGKVASMPTITEKIPSGSAQITMGGSGNAEQRFREAKDLVLVLKAGALPAPVEVREKRQVGKTLGQDTVAKGTLAMGTGALLVVLFMALYYRFSGLLANMALVLNVLFMLALLAWLEATLTLPGMAGIVLTIGMAVDANVLIFERIREELRLGRSPRAAIEAGYNKAFGTIFDSNVTTLIAGVVLMQYGSGPVRGFAITLIIGLTCSLYTSIVVTRLAYDLWSRSGNIQRLSI